MKAPVGFLLVLVGPEDNLRVAASIAVWDGTDEDLRLCGSALTKVMSLQSHEDARLIALPWDALQGDEVPQLGAGISIQTINEPGLRPVLIRAPQGDA